MGYTVIIPKPVQKQLSRLPANIAPLIIDQLSALEKNPRPTGCKKLADREAWRVRVRDYRIIYEIEDRVLRIIVVSIGHRREIYR